jgi:hypothetical protein
MALPMHSHMAVGERKESSDGGERTEREYRAGEDTER